MMKCARIAGRNQPLVVETRPIPTTPPGGVLVKTLYGGICRSDLHIIIDELDLGRGQTFRQSEVLGMEAFQQTVLGHEICGVIKDIGSDVKESELHLGDRVLVYPWIGCGKCKDCQVGDSQICLHNESGTTEIGQRPDLPGGFGDHVVVPNWRHVIPLPSNIPPSVACTLPCGAMTAYHALKQATDAVSRAAAVHGKARMLILGQGGLGIWCLQLARKVFHIQPLQITVGDVSKEKIEQATALGADRAIHWSSTDSVDHVINLLTSQGQQEFDVAIDFVGNPLTNGAGLGVLRKGGSMVAVGLAGGEMRMPIAGLVARSLRVQGVRVAPLYMLGELLHLVASGGVAAPPITEYKLEDINQALDKLRRGELPGRAVVCHDRA